MKRKALFLYSSAVLLGLPPRAEAGAPQPEPEGGAYIRACDAYGKGFFIVPGTETCLKISGYVRSDVKGADNAYTTKYDSRHRRSYAWLSRGTLQFSSVSQTELGPLRGYMEIRSDWDGGAESGSANDSSSGSLRFGYIELGGLRAGMDETVFAYWTGYYGNMINDDIMNPSEKRTNGISYTYNTAGGFSAILALEQGNKYGGNGSIPGSGDSQTISGSRTGGYRFRADGSKDYKELSQQIRDYTPYIVGGLKYAQSWGSVSTVLGYDSYDSEWAVKLRLDANITNRFSLWTMAGYKSMEDYYNLDTTYGDNGARVKTRADGSTYTRYGIYRQVNSMYGDWGGHGAFWLGGTYKFSPQMSFNFQNAYANDKSFSSSANISRQLVAGLTLICEATYKTWRDNYGHTQSNGDKYRVSLKGQNAVQGVVRLQRAF